MTEYDDLKPFFDEMLGIMQHHDTVKGDSWRGPSSLMSRRLRTKLWEEFREIVENEDPENANNLHELVDLANVCAMIWLRGLDEVRRQNTKGAIH